MGKNDVWTVVGVGMGGKGLLADLGLNGYRLRAFDKDDAQVAGIRAAGGIHVDGRPPGKFAPVELATTDPAAALDGAQVILVSVNGDDHRAAGARPRTASRGRPDHRADPGPLLRNAAVPERAEERRLQGEGRCLRARRLSVHDDSARARSGRADHRQGDDAARRACRRRARRTWSRSSARAIRGLDAGPNLLQTGFSDLGSVFHACGIVTNVGIAESGQRYNFYAHNMTPSVCNLIEAVDRERVAIAKAYGIETPDVFKWLEITYNRKERSLNWALQANAVTHYKYSPAPNSLGHRFLVTDVGSGLVGWSSFGKVAGVATPAIDAVIGIAGALTKRDFFEEGRNLRNLGLEGKSAEQIMAFVAS